MRIAAVLAAVPTLAPGELARLPTLVREAQPLLMPSGRLREAYNPDEPRDYHGRWGDGGGSSSALDTKSASSIKISAPKPRAEAGGSYFSDEVVTKIDQAVTDGVARSPELVNGDRPLQTVSYLSAGRPEGMSYSDWLFLKENTDGAQAVTFPADLSNPDKAGVGERIIFNDTTGFNPSSDQAASTMTPYGMAEHEMGHAYFMSHGLNGWNKVADVLTNAGLTPDVLDRVSKYAASSPMEALGELYGMSHTPGFSLPPDIAESYNKIESQAGAGLLPGTHGVALRTLLNTPENNRQIQEAAAANIRAKAWVMHVPALDRWRPSTPPVKDHFTEAARARGFDPGDTRRLREDYNPDEPRDSHGRWGDAGGPAIATEPKTVGGLNQAHLDAAVVQQRLLDINNRNANKAVDTRWYQHAHDQLVTRAKSVGVDPQRFAGMVAATSPRTYWDTVNGKTPNLDKATKAALIARDHLGDLDDPRALADSLEHPGMFKDQLTSALRLYNGEDPGKVLTTPKTASFYNNLMFPGKTDSVTVDEWMARAIAGVTDVTHYQENPETAKVLAGSGKNSGYSWAADQIRAAADKAGISPDALQASVWSQYRRELHVA